MLHHLADGKAELVYSDTLPSGEAEPPGASSRPAPPHSRSPAPPPRPAPPRTRAKCRGVEQTQHHGPSCALIHT
ncbi:hypothetical protein QJS66_08340 [Kocuria rhizophila]|nr:hypothetical protein QJS66_08340 [Kocuria rhizophila]